MIHHDFHGDSPRVADGKVFYRTNHLTHGSRYFAFDLRRRTLEEVIPPAKWALPGLLSPEGTKSVMIDHTAEIILHGVGAKPRSLGKEFHVKHRTPPPNFSYSLPHPPALWLDEERLLTQTGNGRLVVVNVEDGSSTGPIKVPASKEVVHSPRLWRDGNGDIVYECGRELFRVDVEKESWQRYHWEALGHGFEKSPDICSERVIRYQGETIRRRDISTWNASVTAGYIAVKSMPNGKLADGVWVWCDSTRHWTHLPMRADSIVGWVK
jgi:hypothetical protein